MKTKTKRIIIGLITILIIFLMIIYVDFQDILTNLERISIVGIILFCLIYTIAFIFRALKLKIVFNSMNLTPSYLTIYGAIGTGWAINELTPAKLGDIAKMEYIHQKENNFRLSKCLCAVLIDRFIDLIILFSITCLALVYIIINNISIETLPSQLGFIDFFIIIGALVLLAGFVGLLLLLFKTDWILKIIGKISMRLQNYLKKFIYRFVEGLDDFRKDKKRIFKVLIYNIPTWLFESLTLVLLFYLAGYYIDIFIIILAQIVTFFTKTIPITPGGWGISEITGAFLVTLFYPIPYEDVLILFILDHILRIVYVFVYGAISTVSINFKYKTIDLDKIQSN